MLANLTLKQCSTLGSVSTSDSAEFHRLCPKISAENAGKKSADSIWTLSNRNFYFRHEFL